MDGRLARGMARSVFRNMDLARNRGQSKVDALLMPLFECYQRKGGLPVAQIIGRGLALRDALAAAGPYPTQAEILRHSARRRIIVETLCPGVVEGPEQPSMVCGGIVLDITRDELCFVKTVGHFAVSLHTVKRLYERCHFQEADIPYLLAVVRLWSAPLLQVLVETRAVIGAGVAIPFMGGLLLGTMEGSPLKLGQGPTAAVINRTGATVSLLRPAFGVKCVGVRTLSINTFVNAQDFYTDQHEIFAATTRFGNLFAQEFAVQRTGMLRGLPDERMAARFGMVVAQLRRADLEPISDALMRFFASQEWLSHAEAHRRPTRFQ